MLAHLSLAVVLAGVLLPMAVQAQPCEPEWLPQFGSGEPNAAVWELLAIQDSAGPGLLIGGYLNTVGGVTTAGVARWDGDRARAMGTQLGNRVSAMAVYDDGSGPKVYAGGDFNLGSGMARWNGTTWEQLPGSSWNGGGAHDMAVFNDGSGDALFVLSGGSLRRWSGTAWTAVNGAVGQLRLVGSTTLLVYNDGTGEKLYTAGAFHLPNDGPVVQSVGRWTGSGWELVGEPAFGPTTWFTDLVAHTDATGTALYVVGAFSGFGSVTTNRVAKWDGTNWSGLGAGLNGEVTRAASLNGSLYVCGSFTTAGGQPALRSARWNGTSWSAVSAAPNGTVWAMEVFDDGNTEVLYAGGDFSSPGQYLVRLIGDVWTPVNNGIVGTVKTIARVETDSGTALYVGGNFTQAGGLSTGNIAKWDGTAWSALGAGTSAGGSVEALAGFTHGGSRSLIVGGTFPSAGGAPEYHTARWDGNDWSPLGSGVNDPVYALQEFDDGTGNALYAGGDFTIAGGAPAQRVARWDGTSWSPLGRGLNGGVRDFAVFDDGTGEALYAAGGFTATAGIDGPQPALYGAAGWSHLPSVFLEYGIFKGYAVFDDGSGPRLFGAGNFSAFGAVAAWDGSVWAPLGSGLDNNAEAVVVHDDGSGPALYVGGSFQNAGGQQARSVAKWRAGAWAPVGAGLNGPVTALALFNDGTGTALYAGGSFSEAPGVPAGGIGLWNGSAWSTIGTGANNMVSSSLQMGGLVVLGGRFTTLDGQSHQRVAAWDGTSLIGMGAGLNDEVTCLAVFDDGTGAALYAGGVFTASGTTPTSHIARWNGRAWSSVGTGLSGDVEDLIVFDDGSGPALYAAGSFTMAGGAAAGRIARWNGLSWAPVGGTGIDDGSLRALAVFDHGTGPALYAAGDFSVVNGEGGYTGVAKWDGNTWQPVAMGLPSSPVLDLAVFNDGVGPRLFACGDHLNRGVRAFDGTSWALVGNADNVVRSLTVFDSDGAGPLPARLVCGGGFLTMGGVSAQHLAAWNGSTWSNLPSTTGVSVFDLAQVDVGAGPRLLATGFFSEVGIVPATGLMKWNGSAWVSPAGLLPTSVRAMRVLHEPGGPALWISGSVPGDPAGVLRWSGSTWERRGEGLSGTSTGAAADFALFDEDGPGGSPAKVFIAGSFGWDGQTARNIAKWNGSSWTPVGGGLDGDVYALQVFDADGAGPGVPRLYAVGAFTRAGGSSPAAIQADHFVAWDGSSWTAPTGTDQPARSLVAVDYFAEPTLLLSGHFEEVDRIDLGGVAKWDGSAWLPVGAYGPSGQAYCLAVFDDGSGARLYAGVTAQSGASPVQRYQASGWVPVGSLTTGTVQELAVFDYGNGEELYAAGFLFSQGLNHVARWTGSQWAPLGDPAGVAGGVAYALDSFDDGTGPSVYVGGNFSSAGGTTASGIGRWGCLGPVNLCPADFNQDGTVTSADITSFLSVWFADLAGGTTNADFDDSGASTSADITSFLSAWFQALASGCP